MESTLNAETGRFTGSRPATRLRREGMVPGVVYGLGRDTVTVAVGWRDLRKALTTDAGLNALITLEYDGNSELTIVKDLQRDPVRRDVVHVDFLRVDRDAAIDVDVPIITIGEAKEVENNRGIAEQSMKTLTVKAKPGNIPQQFEVDISELTIGQSITVSQIELPEGITTDVDPEASVVSGVATRFTAAEEEAEAEAAEAEGEGAEGEGAEGAEGAAEGEAAAEGGE
jgi:large subunit ribosomal protein L25